MYNKILSIIGNMKILKKNSPNSLRKNITIDKNLSFEYWGKLKRYTINRFHLASTNSIWSWKIPIFGESYI